MKYLIVNVSTFTSERREMFELEKTIRLLEIDEAFLLSLSNSDKKKRINRLQKTRNLIHKLNNKSSEFNGISRMFLLDRADAGYFITRVL